MRTGAAEASACYSCTLVRSSRACVASSATGYPQRRSSTHHGHLRRPKPLPRRAGRFKHRGPDGKELPRSRGPAYRAVSPTQARHPRPFARREPADATPDGRFTLVYNGEVYNFRALRGELQAEGVRFTPTETPKSFPRARAMGRKCARLLRGDVRGRLWDKATGDSSSPATASEKSHFTGLQTSADSRSHPKSEPSLRAAGRRRASTRSASRVTSSVGRARTHRHFSKVSRRSNPDISSSRGRQRSRYGGGGHFLRRQHLPSAGGIALRACSRRRFLRLVSDVPLGLFLSGGIDSAASWLSPHGAPGMRSKPSL